MPAMTWVNEDERREMSSGREGYSGRGLGCVDLQGTFLRCPDVRGYGCHGTQKLNRDTVWRRLHSNTIVLDSLQSQGELYPIGLTLPDLYGLQTAIRDRDIMLVPLRWELRVWQID